MGNSQSTSQEHEEENVHEILDAISKKLSSWKELVQNMKTEAHSWVHDDGLEYLNMALVEDMDNALADLKNRINIKAQTTGSGADDMDVQLLKTCQEDVKRLGIERNQLKDEVDKLTKDMEQRNKRVDNLKTQRQKVEDDLQHLKAENDKLKRDFKKVSEHSQKVKVLYEREQILTKKAQAETRDEREAKEKALKRLSEVAGNQLQFNNPAITDLSDPCRPTNVAEMYTQLYDDEWTTAYAALCDNGKPEKENIQTLKQILMESMSYCKTTFEKQYMSLEQALKSPEKKDTPTEKDKAPAVVAMVNGEKEHKPDETKEETDKAITSVVTEVNGEPASPPTEPKEAWVSMIIHTDAEVAEDAHKPEEVTQDDIQSPEDQDDFVILDTPLSCPTSLTGQEGPAMDSEETLAIQLKVNGTASETNDHEDAQEPTVAAAGEQGAEKCETEEIKEENTGADNLDEKKTIADSVDTTNEEKAQSRVEKKTDDMSKKVVIDGAKSESVSSGTTKPTNDNRETIRDTVEEQTTVQPDADFKQKSAGASVKGQSLYPEVKQGVHNVVKLNAPNFIKRLQKRFLQEHSELPQKEETVPYIEKCVSVCWLMVIQKPQMVFFEQERGEKVFNKDLYKSYTKTGQTIDFVVWPPMLMHEDGPIMCKGIAECTD